MDMKNVFNVYNTLVQLIQDRGYTISQKVDYEEFIIMYEEGNYNIVDDDRKICGVFFKDTKTFGKKDLDTIVRGAKATYGNPIGDPKGNPIGDPKGNPIGDPKGNDNIKILIVLKDKYNVTIQKELGNESYKYVEIFLFQQLTFNITKHVDMPRCIPMTPQEMEVVLKQYAAKKSQFPKMLESDPIAKYYGVKSGGMIKIIRKSITAGEYITYRLVR